MAGRSTKLSIIIRIIKTNVIIPFVIIITRSTSKVFGMLIELFALFDLYINYTNRGKGRMSLTMIMLNKNIILTYNLTAATTDGCLVSKFSMYGNMMSVQSLSDTAIFPPFCHFWLLLHIYRINCVKSFAYNFSHSLNRCKHIH